MRKILFAFAVCATFGFSSEEVSIEDLKEATYKLILDVGTLKKEVKHLKHGAQKKSTQVNKEIPQTGYGQTSMRQHTKNKKTDIQKKGKKMQPYHYYVQSFIDRNRALLDSIGEK